MKRREKTFIAMNLGPALIIFLLIFAYPMIRTILMSFYQIPSISAPMSKWEFVGWGNYKALFDTSIFQPSLVNILKIWFVGGFLTLGLALFFAVILSSGVKGKKFWRSAIYLPNTVNAVALSTMWTQYVFQTKFGFLKKLFTALGMEGLAKINWTSPKYLFWAMLVSFALGSTGYFMLIILAGIERIPSDIYESAKIDGANAWTRFWRLTLPLIRDVLRTVMTFWTITAVNFFTWAKMFSNKITTATVTPINYMYEKVFGASIENSDPGLGAAIGVTVSVIVLVVYFIMNKLMKEEVYEY